MGIIWFLLLVLLVIVAINHRAEIKSTLGGCETCGGKKHEYSNRQDYIGNG